MLQGAEVAWLTIFVFFLHLHSHCGQFCYLVVIECIVEEAEITDQSLGQVDIGSKRRSSYPVEGRHGGEGVLQQGHAGLLGHSLTIDEEFAILSALAVERMHPSPFSAFASYLQSSLRAPSSCGSRHALGIDAVTSIGGAGLCVGCGL